MAAVIQNPTGSKGSLVSAAVLMGIRNLELRARAVVEGFRSGLHRSPYHGFSVEFTEYRQYTPGDDLLLAIGVGARGDGLRHQQRAPAIGEREFDIGQHSPGERGLGPRGGRWRPMG